MGRRGNGHGHYNKNDGRADRYEERRSWNADNYKAKQDNTRQEQPAQPKPNAPRLPVTAGTPNQEKYLKALQTCDVTVCDGPAGCGKTYLSIGNAIHQLLERPGGPIQKIILVRPLVPAGEDPGFLPGTVFELEGNSKAGPYMRPVIHAMQKFCRDWTELKGLFKQKIVEVVPLAFMRGCTFDNTYMILDEAQNATPAQMKMFVTRVGRGSKMVISGDSGQVDLQDDDETGLDKAMRVFARGGFRTGKASVCNLDKSDILRSEFLGEIVEAWESDDNLPLVGHNGHNNGCTNGHPKPNGRPNNGRPPGRDDGDPSRFTIL